MKTLRVLLTGFMLLMTMSIPFKGDAQNLTLTGKGQLTVRPDGADVITMFMQVEFLPQYKPLTKSITITNYFLRNYAGDLLRQHGSEGFNHTCILYDRQGRITKINDLTFLYENDKVTECVGENGLRCKFRYNSQGHLESAMKGNWTYQFNVDKKGNITSIDEYFGSRKTSRDVRISYDNKDRVIAYQEVGTDYRYDYSWNYDGKGNLDSYRRIDSKKGIITKKHEYQFEYGEDGNPIRCINYNHGDITIIDGGYEYEYTYSFYLSPEKLDSINYEDPIDIDYVDVRPSYPKGEYPSGEIKFQIDFTKNMKWINASSAVKDLMKNGEVVVGFVVEPDGTVSSVKVITKEGDFVDEEIERTILSMPKWESGWIDGHKVRVAVSMPFKFSIQQ